MSLTELLGDREPEGRNDRLATALSVVSGRVAPDEGHVRGDLGLDPNHQDYYVREYAELVVIAAFADLQNRVTKLEGEGR